MPSAIEDYALIGDLETAALVARDGSIDWLCLPRFDSPACFAALLGSPENGRWQLAPKGKFRVHRRYTPDTLILETQFRTARGTATLIDFMPLRYASPRIVRIVRGDSGTVEMQMSLVIRFDYGLTVPWVTQKRKGALEAVAGPNRLILRTNAPLRGEAFTTVSNFTVRAGRSVQFELEYGNSFERRSPKTNSKSALREATKLWRKWVSRRSYTGPQSEAVKRSLITLKALTYRPTGGIIAAPTTSLPERPGGDCNWDYRYCWVRDATFALLGFIHAGFHKEAQRWKNWLVHSVAGNPEQMQIMYGPTGERLLHEWEISWLAGYRGALPVRVGNAASEQLQLDVYGELADVMHQSRKVVKVDGVDFNLQLNLIDNLRKIWRLPDHGIWEFRDRGHHYTHSKVMAWVAFDRSIRDAEQYGFKSPLPEWRKVRQEIRDEVLSRGFNSRLNSFVQSYGSTEVDASLLLIPLVGFLPATDPRVVGTVHRVEKKLMRGGFVMRFLGPTPGTSTSKVEGAFLPCTLWLADYYCLVGRRDAARRLLNRVMRVSNDVGLLAEEYDTEKKRFLGNFPQAFTHVALLNTIINLHAKHGPARQRSAANHSSHHNGVAK